ncbi:DUF4870 domain-containing protein [Zobellia galactanivorans]|uniref:DUF4870 domain-containing protein n=1 Tax=Zobellia galactanivorans (strain DSM 12802 / CCUG 47099 / CIP 106680 / NCIMB 13871 / Dsij) TaxID=63186 RepID=UPI001C079058|nr:hypothetical protein [Zobellia galactanivorans]MBU3026544.1 hypothetical protein [Zobellia galactanivorans]
MKNSETKIDTAQTAATTDENDKTIAILAYITVIGLVVAFVMNNEKKQEFARYHFRQSVGLCITGLCLGIIGLIPILGWLINILGVFVLLYMWVMALMNALNGKESPAPILGKKYEVWFKGV